MKNLSDTVIDIGQGVQKTDCDCKSISMCPQGLSDLVNVVLEASLINRLFYAVREATLINRLIYDASASFLTFNNF